jgi:hypothetical protein
LTALGFGLAPLRSLRRLPLSTALKTSASTAHQDRDRAWGRKIVVGLQVALCLMLLVGAGLPVRTLHNREQNPLGMRTAGLLRALPSVESVTLMENRIGSGWSNNTVVFVDGRNPQGDRSSQLRWNSVGPDYVRTLGTPLLYGRDILEGDGLNAPKVAIVNETFVKRYLAGRKSVGPQHCPFERGGCNPVPHRRCGNRRHVYRCAGTDGS